MNRKKWLDCALRNGFESFEIRTSSHRHRKLSWFGGQADGFVSSDDSGTVMRGLYGGKMANYSTGEEDDSKMEGVIAGMKERAGLISSEDREFIRKPEASGEAKSSRVWIRPESAEILSFLSELEKKILAYDPRITQVIYLDWSDRNFSKRIVNSYGMDVENSGCFQMVTAGAAASDGGEVKNYHNFAVVAELSGFDTEPFVRKLCDGVLAKLGASSLPSGKYPVIMEKDAMTDLFSAFSVMFSGELIEKGISPLRGKLGQSIFSECVTIVDDPRNDSLVIVTNYDDEGCPTRRKALVENGVFKQMLHDSKSAARSGAESSGNAFSGTISPMGCCIAPGTRTLSELCEDMGEGLVVTELQGLHAGIDHVTADFSLQCQGYLVKNGKRDRSVSLITVAGNFLELMKHVSAVGSDLDWSCHMTAAPSIAFESIAVSGE